MLSIVGLVIMFICVFGGFVMAGGNMAPIIKAAPIETFIIGGAATGAMICGNSLTIVKGTLGGIGKLIAGPAFKKQDYMDVIFLVSKIMKVLKAEGAVALESHVENPEASAIFGEYPKLLKDHALIHLITDTIRLLVVSSSAPRPDAIEDIMNLAIKTHHHEALKPAETFAGLAGALPALGIVACVLGVVKTMGAIDQPPPVLGALIGSALVGTFMGVLLAYGVAGPFAVRIGQVIEEDNEIYKCVQQLIVANLHGHPMPLVIEAARSVINSHNKPSFGEIFDGMRGK